MPNATCAECGAIADDHDEFHIHQRFPAGRSARARWSARAAGATKLYGKTNFWRLHVATRAGPPRAAPVAAGARFPLNGCLPTVAASAGAPQRLGEGFWRARLFYHLSHCHS
jgi:hypothetical protein